MSWVTTWVADPLGLLLAVVLTGGYAAGVLAARRRGTSWPWGRTAVYAVLGVGTLVLATCGALAAYRGTLFWVGAAQATVLSAVTPLGLALGDPLGLARAAWPPLGRGVGPGLTRLGRVAMFPLVSSVVAAGVLVVLFFTPWFASSLTTAWVRELLYVVLLLTGTLVVLPLLSTELLPAWCTHPVRAFLAFVDGLIDAVPGILVMTTPQLLTVGVGAAGLTAPGWGPAPMWDQRLGGGGDAGDRRDGGAAAARRRHGGVDAGRRGGGPEGRRRAGRAAGRRARAVGTGEPPGARGRRRARAGPSVVGERPAVQPVPGLMGSRSRS